MGQGSLGCPLRVGLWDASGPSCTWTVVIAVADAKMSSPLASAGLGVKVGKAARAQGVGSEPMGAWPVRYRGIPDIMLAWWAASLERTEGASNSRTYSSLGYPLSD